MAELRISWYTVTDCLGPGKRFALWVQGCERRCGGCIAKALQDTGGGTLADTDALAREITASGADGITVSGGEPFLQPEPLARLLGAVRARADMGVIIYTGYLYEELLKDPGCAELLGMTDLLVDGEYVAELDDGRAMRGSSNQRLIYLTDRYRPEDMPECRTGKAVFSDGSFRVIGIPSGGAKKMLGIFGRQEGNDRRDDC